MPRLLIVSHAPSEKSKLLAGAVVNGASRAEFGSVDLCLLNPFEAAAHDVKAAQAIILGTTENFGYMSGAMKDFFDRIYYACLEQTEALPYALFVRAGNDGSGAVNSMQRIIAGLKWKEIQPPLICAGAWQSGFTAQAEELGMTIAAGMDAGIF